MSDKLPKHNPIVRAWDSREKRPSEPYEKEVLNWRYIHPAFPFYSFDSVEVIEVPVDAAPQTERTTST